MLRLLLIDDSPEDRLLIVYELRREFPDLQVEEVVQAEGFSRALNAGNFDLVITDYQIRWTDGLIVLRKIKSRYPNCPVLMFTGSGNQEIAVEAMKAGLDDYIIKSPKHYIRVPIAVRSCLQRAESQQKVLRLEMRLESLLNRLNVGVFRATLEGRILEGNAAFLRLLGVNSLQEAFSLNWQDLFPNLEAGLDSLNPEREVQLRRSDGSFIWLSVSQTLNTTEDEPVIEGLIEDITDRKLAQEALQQARDELEIRVAERTQELRQANELLLVEMQEREQAQQDVRDREERYRQLVELSPDAIFVQCDGRFLFVNSATVKLFGAKSQDELINRPVLDIVHPDDQDIASERIRHLREQGKPVERREEKFLKLDGTVIDVEVAAAPFTYQEKPAAQVVVRNISDVYDELRLRKRAEEELRNALEKERELSHFKSRFISTISHEYRTPLTIIQSSAELLERYEHKWSKEKKLIHFQRILASTRHLTNLVNDVLFIGQAEMKKLEFNPAQLNLEEFCLGLVEEFCSSISNQTTITSNIQCNCTNACLDEKLLRQILANLLSNAIKYSPDGGTIRFDLECRKGAATLRIQDSGIGIPTEDFSQLFESFHRARNVGTIPGTGLGLAIVKKCVDLHGGQITVESEAGVGTTFTVTLPFSPPSCTFAYEL
ncbi:PAS domain S-box protein [Allocoleopsis sp.]|uniref:hybrid sensor histidine kinase/response regulator n=1 Tax=Allocoleopsis sp. TaxID=3088169 RepID=UPI002FD10B06